MILQETAANNDRGFVLLCGAVLDRALEKLIRMKFTDISQTTEEELDFLLIKQPVPPLGSAGIRIRVARVLGVIDETICEALSELNDIRNSFAHEEIAPTLNNDLIRPIYDNLPKEYKQAFAIINLELKKEDQLLSSQNLLRIVTAILLSILVQAQVKLRARIALSFGLISPNETI